MRGARSGSRSPGSRSPASRLESMIGGLSDESELSSSSDEEALRRQRARVLQAAEARVGALHARLARERLRTAYAAAGVLRLKDFEEQT